MFSLADVTHLCLDFLSALSIILAQEMEQVPTIPRLSFSLSLKSSLLSCQPTAASALDFARPLTLRVSVVKSICVTARQK